MQYIRGIDGRRQRGQNVLVTETGDSGKGCPPTLGGKMSNILLAVSFALSMGTFLLFLGMFLDYLHERRRGQRASG